MYITKTVLRIIIYIFFLFLDIKYIASFSLDLGMVFCSLLFVFAIGIEFVYFQTWSNIYPCIKMSFKQWLDDFGDKIWLWSYDNYTVHINKRLYVKKGMCSTTYVISFSFFDMIRFMIWYYGKENNKKVLENQNTIKDFEKTFNVTLENKSLKNSNKKSNKENKD